MRKRRNRVLCGLILAVFLMVSFSSTVQADDWTQTTQSDFETGSGVNIDTISDPGNVTLAQHWQKYPTVPVVDLGPPGSWDDFGITYPAVIKDGATFKMWYTGSDGSAISPYRIGYATSSDGITWTKSLSNPVFGLGAPSSWDDSRVYMASVFFNGTTYQMWYTGNDGAIDRIGYATSPDGISWTRYAGNPVLSLGSPGSWEDAAVRKPSVVHDGSSYHMWYSGYDGSTWRIGLATSLDGALWTKNPANPVINPGPPGSWDDSSVAEAGSCYEGGIFHIWYSGADGSSARTGYATSADGVVWTKNPANPVLDRGPAGSWEEINAFEPTVLFDNGEYHMWYAGRDATNYRVGYATSPDGITWTKKPSMPVVGNGAPGSWEEWYVNGPSVIFNGTGYQLWYTGSNGLNAKVGYATSADGISWSKNPSNPVMINGPAPWESVHAAAPSVIYDGMSYHMWYCGFDGTNWRIGYATSPDGITWTKSGSNPVLDLGSPGDWDGMWVHDPSVIFDGVEYHMWFGGYDGVRARIGYATSPDGINWSQYAGNSCPGTSGDGCVLDIGPSGAWDYNNVEDPTVVFDGKTYMMWYSGHDGLNPRIGFAASTDGINWTRHSGNPVLDLGPSGYWDDFYVHEPAAIIDGPTLKMWYSAHDGAKARIGYAAMHYWRTGNFTSLVFDSGAGGTIWNSVNWTESLPPGTNITMATRTGESPTPDASWSTWSAEMWDESGSAISSPASRYIQYRATFVTSDRDATPILSHVNINYTLADTGPPSITDLSENPDPQEVFGSVNITANITDETAVDEVWINISGEGNFSMFFDSISDLYYYEASYSTIATFAYTIWANDTLAKWASASGSFVIHDTTPPIISNNLENPDPQEVYGSVNISANITDNFALDYVCINISGQGNFSMILDTTSGLHYYENSYTDLGMHSYTIWANDTSDNWASASGSFAIRDTTLPVIEDLVEDPDPQYEGGHVRITAKVTDSVGVDEVRISIAGVGNFTMNYDPLSDLYHYNASYSAIGTYPYTIWAKDTSGNWNSASSSFTIMELPDEEEHPDDWWWILLVIVIIILVIIILFLLMRRRRKEEEEEAPPQSIHPPTPDESSITHVPPPPPP